MAAAASCRDLEGEASSVMPSYCCWEGVHCCHEHSIYVDALKTPCRQYSVFILALRAGNLTRSLGPVMPQLATLHQHGMVGLDLSRNFITGPLPPSFNELSNLQLLLLGANSEQGGRCVRGACDGLQGTGGCRAWHPRQACSFSSGGLFSSDGSDTSPEAILQVD